MHCLRDRLPHSLRTPLHVVGTLQPIGGCALMQPPWLKNSQERCQEEIGGITRASAARIVKRGIFCSGARNYLPVAQALRRDRRDVMVNIYYQTRFWFRFAPNRRSIACCR